MYNTSLALCIAINEIITWQYRKGPYDQFSFISFIYETVRYLTIERGIPADRILLILDNAGMHLSYYCRAKLKELGIHIHFNAPMSPQLNFIENVFGDLKRVLRNECCSNYLQM